MVNRNKSTGILFHLIWFPFLSFDLILIYFISIYFILFRFRIWFDFVLFHFILFHSVSSQDLIWFWSISFQFISFYFISGFDLTLIYFISICFILFHSVLFQDLIWFDLTWFHLIWSFQFRTMLALSAASAEDTTPRLNMTARTSTLGCATATRIAATSSTPGSVIMITFVELLARSQTFKTLCQQCRAQNAEVPRIVRTVWLEILDGDDLRSAPSRVSSQTVRSILGTSAFCALHCRHFLFWDSLPCVISQQRQINNLVFCTTFRKRSVMKWWCGVVELLSTNIQCWLPEI